MREIKFRAWSKQTKKWINIMSLNYCGNEEPWIGDGQYSHPLSSIELMQYTSLKDKNGKEIYEGDIVNARGIKSEPQILSVLWKDNFWAICNSEIVTGLHPLSFDGEIIGNIYENPELLKP